MLLREVLGCNMNAAHLCDLNQLYDFFLTRASCTLVRFSSRTFNLPKLSLFSGSEDSA